ncbi:cordon-bleu protein-like 1 isoform X6 [Daphnia carinata]|uniref:cordon-bleu protein-like 1 isoform X6 n=1 Tax=Daphnia carinata TaxID=120202 RepID=UPI0025811540|nr:cordon-bleu protein-like 1 isoform X6 [Daphnia carinata]
MKMVPAPPPMTSSPIMSSAHQQFEVTEDTPVDFLEGCMEILVIFPNEKSILMSIQRRMPMLDLLIHVTAANKISPAAHLLQVTDEEGRFLPHKPSTPIGSLNAHKVYILAKNRLMSDRSDSRSSNAKSSSASQFEQSFRVQVRLPRNQLFVTRVTGRTQLADLLHTVCNEKALDPRHYELRHPVNLDERLRLSSCLDDYKLQEVVLVPLGGKNASLLTPSVSVSDLSSSSSNSMNRKSVNLSASNSSKMSSKSTLKPTTSEATLVGHEKKKRGLLGLLGFGKHKKGSSMGDSGMGDSVGDRSISPSRSEEPVPPAPPVEPVAPSPPSPVLFSKRLAEEAVAKRNSRLMLSQMSTEAFTTPTSTDGPPPLRKTISTTSNGATPPANKPIAKKKRAPAPPQPPPSTQSNGMNGPPKISVDKAASEVSSYSTSSSSGSNYVSPTTSVIHHSEEEVVLRSSSPKLSYQRQDSNYMSRQRQPDSGCSSPVRSPRSNMITTPGNSSSNLTQVSSTSNASLASAIKKRKAPVPPPALDEQVEASEKIPPATVTVVVDGSHDDSDRVSSVSDQLSSVSDLSSTRKSETPDIIEPAIVVELTPQHRHYEQQQQQTSDLDSPRSIATDSTNANSERPANSISSEDDYEQLEYRRKNSDEKEKNDSYREAHEEEETVVSEPIYTMVIKPPKPLVAVDLEPQTNDKMEQTNEDVQVDEPDRCDVKAIVMLREEEPEMERDAGDGQTESPIMWEYKLPAPPTPFQDSAQSPLDKLQIASESELSRSTRSSMSTDSLQQNRSADEENFAKDSPRSSIDCQEPEAETSAEISIKEDNDVKEVALKLHRGLELLGETTTEEPSLDDPAIEEVVNVAEENKVVLQSSDPEAKPYGIESTTDEPMSQPSSLPPMPSTLPPIDSDDEFSPPDMQFSIATYTVRVSKDSPYEKKLTRPVLPEEVSENIINPINDSTKEANNPLPIVTETKEQEMIADPVKTEENSGSSPVPAAGQLPLPMLNADFIQQFQNALHSITDPKARALQEEFLRLQQQFLTLQMQAVVQQNSAVTVESDPVDISTDHSDTTTLKEKTVLIEEAPTAADLQAEPLVEADSKQIQLVESPVEPPLKITDPAQEQLPKQEIELELETPVYRYTGPPQVKLDTWKPGRPRSEVIDYSRSSSFNVPLAPVEKKIDAPVIGTVAATVLAMDTNTSSPTVATIPEEVVLPVQVSRIPEEESKIKPIVSEVEEILAVREKIEHIESSSNNSSNCTSPVLKPIVLRKSSFITARPFEARPVSMPIRRPNFTPMVIQPVPFVFGKMRAPEVRGFASLPPDNRVEMQGIRMTGPTGVTPFSAVNKNRSIAPVSKENPTIVIRNKLIESARRPSAELNGTPLKSEDSPDQVEDTFAEVKETSPAAVETRRTTSSIRPLSMPMSSSLLLAAGAGGVVNKPQPLSPEISKPPIAAQPTAISGADPSTTAGRRSLSSKFVRKVDPREELLNSIRSFANGGSLKKTGASLDK